MIDVPRSWKVVENLLVGIVVDPQSLSYQIHLLDLFQYKSWTESVSNTQLKSRLSSQGFDDITDENIKYLLNALEKAVEDQQLQLTNTNGELIGKVSNKSVDWEFKFSGSGSLEILCKYILQQTSTINYLNFKFEKVVQLIEQKDHYIKYLSENYKSINGDELMRKYYKNNPDIDHELLNKFDESVWSDTINFGNDSDVNNLKNAIKIRPLKRDPLNAKEHQEFTEAFDYSYSPKKGKVNLDHVKQESPSPFIKEELVVEERTIKQEPTEQEPPKGNSPKRRKRQGMIRSKERT